MDSIVDNGWEKNFKAIDLLVVFGVVLSIKFIFVYFDSDPMFFMGDSGTYIGTAVSGAIPRDRSFVYGFIVRLLGLKTGSLSTLVFFQTIMSAFSTVFVLFILLRYFKVSFFVAAGMTILCALDPIQLLYERFVMTETVSLLLFAGYILLVFEYIRSQKLIYLLFMHLIGVCVVSLRISFLPLILVNGFVAPMLIAPVFNVRKNEGGKVSLRCDPSFRKHRFFTAQMVKHLVASILVMACFHHAYRLFNAYLSNAEQPAYQYEGGFFLLADWAPVLKTVDFHEFEKAETILGGVKFPLGDLKNRGLNRWVPGGLVRNIKKKFTDRNKAEKFASQVAINALKRDPIGILQLGWRNIMEYWDIDYLKICMKDDRGGSGRSLHLPEALLDTLQNNFKLSARELPYKATLTKFYFETAWWYPLVLLALPLIALLALPWFPLAKVKYSILLFLATIEIVSVACFLIERPTVRYLHPAGWLFFIVFGVFLHRIVSLRLRTFGRILM